MNTLSINQMEQIEGGDMDCVAASAAVAATAITLAISGPFGWFTAAALSTTLGIAEGHALYEACFE